MLAFMLLATLGDGQAQAARAASPPIEPICGSGKCTTITVGAITTSGAAPGDLNGAGTITSNPAGINCSVKAGAIVSGTCTYPFTWTTSAPTLTITLTGTAATGSLACEKYCGPSSMKPVTVIIVSGEAGGAATWGLFGFQLTKQPLTVSKTGTGTGKVSSSVAGIDCGLTCGASFDYGTGLTLTAKPDAGASFTQWTGACNGQGASCSLSITAATATNAVFGLATQTTTTTATTTAATTTTTTTTTAAATTTTTGTTSTTATTGSNGTGGAARAEDKSLDAQLIDAKAGRSRLGGRIDNVEIQTGETISVGLSLTRGTKRLAHHRFTGVKKGDRVLTLVIPAGVAKGKAKLLVTLTDSAGNAHTLKRTISVPGK